MFIQLLFFNRFRRLVCTSVYARTLHGFNNNTIFGLSTYTENILENSDFLRKAVHFPEIIPNSETLTGTHGLSQHVKLVHSDKRKFECSTTFLHAGALQRHVQVVHEKVKPFSCPICEKTFTQNCRVKHHVKLVHEKPVKNSSMVDVEDS